MLHHMAGEAGRGFLLNRVLVRPPSSVHVDFPRTEGSREIGHDVWWAGAKLSSLSSSTETAVAGYQTFRRRCFVHFGGSFQVLSCVPPPVDGKSREVSKVELFWLNKRPFYAKVLGEREGPYISGYRGWRDGKVILFYPRPSIERIRSLVLYTKRVYFACWSPNHTMKGVERVSWKVDPS